jgi:hypothetical protein
VFFAGGVLSDHFLIYSGVHAQATFTYDVTGTIISFILAAFILMAPALFVYFFVRGSPWRFVAAFRWLLVRVAH